MAIHRQGNALVCVGTFTNAGAAATGLTVSCDVWEIPLVSGSPTKVVDAASATEIASGGYYYRASLSVVDANALYAFVFTKVSGTADSAVVWQGWSVGMVWVENLDAAITTRASQTSVDTIDDLIDSEVGTIVTAVAAIEADTQDIQSKIGTPAGVSVSADIAAVQADTDNLQTRIPASLSSGKMRSQVEGMDADTLTASALATTARDEIVDAMLDELLAGHVVVGSVGEALTDAGGGSSPEDIAEAILGSAVGSGDTVDEALSRTKAINIKTALIATGGFEIAPLFDPTAKLLRLKQGDDYPATLTPNMAFSSSDWPDLTDAEEVRLTVRRRPSTGTGSDPILLTLIDNPALRVAGEGIEQSITFEPMSEANMDSDIQQGSTDDLVPGALTGKWDVQATLSGGIIKTLPGLVGYATVEEDQTRPEES